MAIPQRPVAGSRAALLVGVALTTVVGLVPDRQLLTDLTAPRPWVARVGADRAATQCAAALLWLIACWTLLALTACVAARLPGAVGSGAGRLAMAAVPRCLRPILVAATGAGIVLSPALGTAAQPAPGPAPTAQPALAPTPGWPTNDPVPTPAWPTRSAPAPAQPAPPTALPKARRTPPATPVGGSRGGPHVVTVRPGDSLWSIAAAHDRSAAAPTPSTARIARAWPSWFAANRAVIGDDPNLIRPGERLRVPTADHTTQHHTTQHHTTQHHTRQGGQP